MYTEIFKKIPMLIAGVMLLAAAVKIYFRAKNVSRTEFVRIFKTANYLSVWVLIVSIVLSLVFGVANHMNMRHSVSAILSLNYSEASQALNSNGTRYNMVEIISDEVVEKAIKNGAFEDVTVKQLKDCLSVYPCVQGGVGDESEYHISTEFAVDYYASKHTSHLDAENVIQLVTSAYKEYYIEKYTGNFKLDTDAQKPDFKQMEYMDAVSYLDKEAASILSYLYGMAEKNPSFVTENNTTFNSIAGKVFQFRETQINQNLKSMILQNGIVKNREEYIGRLEHQNISTEFERQKSAASYNICNQAVDIYSEEMTRVVLVPTWDESGKYYMGRTKVGIDELSVQATKFSDSVAANEKIIMDNDLVIGKINSADASEQEYLTADEIIEAVYADIKAFEREAIHAGRECGSHNMNQCISVSIYGVSLVNELKILILFAMFAYVSLMLFEIAGKFPKRA